MRWLVLLVISVAMLPSPVLALSRLASLPGAPNLYYAHWTTRLSGVPFVIGIHHMDAGFLAQVPLTGMRTSGNNSRWRELVEPLFLATETIPVSPQQEFAIRIFYSCYGLSGGQFAGRGNPSGLSGSGCDGFPSKMKLRAEWTFEEDVPAFLQRNGKVDGKVWKSSGEFSSKGLQTVIKLRLQGDERPQRSMLNLWVVDPHAGQVLLGGVPVTFSANPTPVHQFVFE